MRCAIAVTALLVVGCGRSTLFDEARPANPPAPPVDHHRSELLGHWADFVVGNCINDEAWLSFDGDSTLTVTSVDRNFCGEHSIAEAAGSFDDLGDTLDLRWAPASGQRRLLTSFSVRPRTAYPYLTVESYQPGDRELVTGVWQPGPGGFTRVWEERFEESGQTYHRVTHAGVSFDVPVATALGACTARLSWQSTVEWGADPVKRLDEVFELPCRVALVDGERRVTATALDTYDGFWKLLTARGLDRSYGWDLDRLAYGFGPDWIVGADGRLYQRRDGYAPTYTELLNPPPSTL